MKVDIKLEVKGVKQKIERNVHRVQLKLDQQVAKDSNFYCPEDVGNLQDSVIPSAAQGKGLLEWNIIYAKYQYYIAPNKSKDKNPNARNKWFEWAKATKKKNWVRLCNAEYNR